MKPKPAPAGSQEAPGFILDVFDGSAWMTKDGQVTTEWKERGVWGTYEEAEKAMKEFTKEMQ
jgi:hypothetical protein